MFQSKAGNSVIIRGLSFFTLVFLLFFSCGIDVYHFIEPPKCNQQRTGSTDDLNSYFDFTTADTSNNNTALVGDLKSLGTEIYYKIYTSESTMQTQIEAIKTANTEYSDSGFNKMSSYDYKLLESDKNKHPIIQGISADSNIVVYPFATGTQTNPTIRINGVDYAKPTRTNNYGNFDFTLDSAIAGNDIQEFDTPASDVKVLWINAYAVSVGSVNNLQRVYSSLCPLGYIRYDR